MDASEACAQDEAEADHTIVIELGVASDWGLTGEPFKAGAALAAEVTPIEHWLELEAGVTVLGATGSREIQADLLFKKPWRLSSRAEFMAGIGPEVSWDQNGPSQKRSLATEIAADFMYWAARSFGWFAEPSYSFTGFGHGSRRSVGLAAGVLLGWP